MTSKADKELLKQARARYKHASEVEHDQRQRELDDLKFYADDQWPDDIKSSRKGQASSASQQAIPARPCLVINKLRDPIRHVEAEAEQTDLGPEIVPADDFAELVGPIDDTEIELREGLVRKIQRESGAKDARNWAASRARIAGRGYYVVMTRYVSSRSNDQEIYLDRLYNQSTALIDPAHEQPDGSDAEWGFYGTDLDWEVYKAEHPNRASARPTEVGDEEWRALGDEAPDWFVEETTGDGEHIRSVRVMNYFYTERTSVELVELIDGRVVDTTTKPPDDQIRKGEDGKPITRTDVQKTITWCKIDGAQILDETEWPSPFIPIIKVVGEELQPFDTERRYQGMVRPARDAQMGFNFMASTEVEIALLGPKTPIIGYAGQFEGFETAWDQANVRNIGRLEANANTDQVPSGTILPLPTAIQRSSNIGEFDGLRGMFDQAIRATTGTPDATLGNVDPSIRSGRAVKALQESAKQGTSGYLSNLVKSITYEAKIINSLLEPIYGRRPGRLMQMMTGKYESQPVIVGTPMVTDAKQRAVPFDAQQHQGQTPKQYTLTKDATFNVAIRVSKNYDTRRQEVVSEVGELIGARPELLSWFGDLYFEHQDGPGHKEMAERAKLMLAPPIQAHLAEKAGGAAQIPPQIQAQMQQMSQALQQAQHIIQTDQVKQQGALEETKIKAANDYKTEELKANLEIRLKEMDNAKAIEVARIGAAKEASNIAQEAAEERLATGLQMQHDVRMAGVAHVTQQAQAQQSAAQAEQQQGAQFSHEQQMAQQAADQAAQQEPANAE